jgi:DNA-binding NarL/FixJ family response regulator
MEHVSTYSGDAMTQKNVRVFIVDDSAFIRARLITMLCGFEEIEIVGQTEDAVQAAESIRELNPDVVILDIRLRGGSGIDVLHNIKHDRLAPITIILTNHPNPQYRERVRHAGADFFFDKSTEFEKIIDVVKQLTQEQRCVA